LEQNSNVEQLIDGYAGRFTFCQYCEQNRHCLHKYRKILWTSQLIIDFVYEIEGGFKKYIWEGNLYNQPIWFMQMLRIAQKELYKIRSEGKK